MKCNLFRTICFSALTLGALSPGHAFGKQATGVSSLKTGVYYIINDQRQKGTDLYVYVTNNELKGKAVSSSHNKNHEDVFVLHKQDDNKFTIQSLKDGKYVQTVGGNNQTFKVADASYTFDILKQTGVGTTAKTYFNIFHDTKKHENCWHLDAGKAVVQWKPLSENGGHGLSPSEFIFDEVTTMTTDSVRKILASKSKAVDPRTDLNAYYQIISNPYGISMREDYVAGNLTTETYSASDYLFLWQLVKLSNGRYALKNAVTGKYVVPQGSTRSQYYTTSTSQGTGFTVEQNLEDPYETVFEMYDGANGIHCAASQGYHPVGWTKGVAANKWIFKVVKVDAAMLKQQQDAYKARVDLRQNGSTYATAIKKYFTDDACTKVTDQVKNMADDALKTQMTTDKLPAELQAIVLKMKNQSWQQYKSGINWEQRYRIHDYKVYSEYEYGSWARVNGLGYNYGDLTNPTGITAQDGDNLFIFVGADIPAGSTLKAQLIPMGSRNGTEVELKKGLNVIFNRFENSVCISYIGKTFGQNRTLASFRDMPIHIEGGKVNGFFDLTQNDDDTTWVKMQADGLVWAKAFQMKDTDVLLHMPGADCKKYTPVKMKELVQIWNSIVKRETDMMGLRSRNTEKCNNLLNATGVDHNYMYASTGGTYYNYSTLGEVLNYDKMVVGNGVLWGPAHEFGHNHQQLVNMAGMTEISNNMFSNMIIFTSGHITSRTQNCTYTDPDGVQVKNVPESKVSTFADRYANKNYWFEYGTWGTTQMYYKLYLMYIASGNKPDFFHNLFLELAKKPMSGRGTTTCRGTTDYLRFAEACCKAANEDLSSFFQSWGFFYDVKDVVIGDYSNTTMNTSTAEWQASLKKMKSYPKGVGNNMIFIDDHIRYTPATYVGAKPGELRQDFSDQAKVGRFGDYGSWDTFRPDSLGQGWAEIGSQKDVNGKRTYTMKAMNNKVVGYKVYDTAGNLVYFANTKTFTIPKKVMDAAKGNVEIKVCGSDGSEVKPGEKPTAIRLVETKAADGLVNVYNLSGVLVRSNVDRATATVGLPAGIYVVGDKKIAVE